MGWEHVRKAFERGRKQHDEYMKKRRSNSLIKSTDLTKKSDLDIEDSKVTRKDQIPEE